MNIDYDCSHTMQCEDCGTPINYFTALIMHRYVISFFFFRLNLRLQTFRSDILMIHEFSYPLKRKGTLHNSFSYITVVLLLLFSSCHHLLSCPPFCLKPLHPMFLLIIASHQLFFLIVSCFFILFLFSLSRSLPDL